MNASATPVILPFLSLITELVTSIAGPLPHLMSISNYRRHVMGHKSVPLATHLQDREENGTYCRNTLSNGQHVTCPPSGLH